MGRCTMGVWRISCPRHSAYMCVSWGERGKERGAVVPLYGRKVEASIRTPAKKLCINRAERGKTLATTETI